MWAPISYLQRSPEKKIEVSSWSGNKQYYYESTRTEWENMKFCAKSSKKRIVNFEPAKRYEFAPLNSINRYRDYHKDFYTS